MSDEREQPVCEVCGKPATSATQDCISQSFPDSICNHFRTNGDPHFYCNEHFQEPRMEHVSYMFTRSDGRSVFDRGATG